MKSYNFYTQRELNTMIKNMDEYELKDFAYKFVEACFKTRKYESIISFHESESDILLELLYAVNISHYTEGLDEGISSNI